MGDSDKEDVMFTTSVIQTEVYYFISDVEALCCMPSSKDLKIKASTIISVF
jgi:hypothetical protein